MIVALAFATGAILAAVAVWLLQREEILYLRREKAIADDRLLHAWKDDKAIIPPRPIEVKPVEKLAPALQECIDEWESPEARAAEEARIRKMLDSGWGVQAILRKRENLHPT